MSDPKAKKRRRLSRLPLVHFLALGGVLFALDRFWLIDEQANTIAVGPEKIAEIEAGWGARTGQQPDATILDALINTYIEEELLLHEARSFGWHRSDAVVQRRLVQNQRFLDEDESVSEKELLRRAYTQGMDKSDLVVRRRLLERMRLLLASRARLQEPSEAELQDYLREHPERFVRPERMSLTHVFLSRDQHRDALEEVAQKLGEKLQTEAISPSESSTLGDPFLLSRQIALASRNSLERQLGPDFALRAMELPLARWSGPIPSSYGVHWVWPHERKPAELPELEAIRKSVVNELLREREQAAIRAHVAQLRERSNIQIDAPLVD